MVNWYYVKGSERVGPVDEVMLKSLFHKGELDLESYIWKKGFTDWERLKNVSELNFTAAPKTEVAPVAQTPVAATPAKKEEAPSEVKFQFDWKSVKKEEELFFLKLGQIEKILQTLIFMGLIL